MNLACNAPIHAWRHPPAKGAVGRCIGHTDLSVDRRKAKRLARRIQRAARRSGLPRVVLTSPLRRAADVGCWLRRWGWLHRIDSGLIEVDFGRWEGRAWQGIERSDIDAWCADFAQHRPGGGESVAALLARVAAWQPGAARVLVTHGGWLCARRWLQEHSGLGGLPDHASAGGRLDADGTFASMAPRSDQWPQPPAHGSLSLFDPGSAVARTESTVLAHAGL